MSPKSSSKKKASPRPSPKNSKDRSPAAGTLSKHIHNSNATASHPIKVTGIKPSCPPLPDPEYYQPAVTKFLDPTLNNDAFSQGMMAPFRPRGELVQEIRQNLKLKRGDISAKISLEQLEKKIEKREENAKMKMNQQQLLKFGISDAQMMNGSFAPSLMNFDNNYNQNQFDFQSGQPQNQNDMNQNQMMPQYDQDPLALNQMNAMNQNQILMNQMMVQNQMNLKQNVMSIQNKKTQAKPSFNKKFKDAGLVSGGSPRDSIKQSEDCIPTHLNIGTNNNMARSKSFKKPRNVEDFLGERESRYFSAKFNADGSTDNGQKTNLLIQDSLKRYKNRMNEYMDWGWVPQRGTWESNMAEGDLLKLRKNAELKKSNLSKSPSGPGSHHSPNNTSQSQSPTARSPKDQIVLKKSPHARSPTDSQMGYLPPLDERKPTTSVDTSSGGMFVVESVMPVGRKLIGPVHLQQEQEFQQEQRQSESKLQDTDVLVNSSNLQTQMEIHSDNPNNLNNMKQQILGSAHDVSPNSRMPLANLSMPNQRYIPQYGVSVPHLPTNYNVQTGTDQYSNMTMYGRMPNCSRSPARDVKLALSDTEKRGSMEIGAKLKTAMVEKGKGSKEELIAGFYETRGQRGGKGVMQKGGLGQNHGQQGYQGKNINYKNTNMDNYSMNQKGFQFPFNGNNNNQHYGGQGGPWQGIQGQQLQLYPRTAIDRLADMHQETPPGSAMIHDQNATGIQSLSVDLYSTTLTPNYIAEEFFNMFFLEVEKIVDESNQNGGNDDELMLAASNTNNSGTGNLSKDQQYQLNMAALKELDPRILVVLNQIREYFEGRHVRNEDNTPLSSTNEIGILLAKLAAVLSSDDLKLEKLEEPNQNSTNGDSNENENQMMVKRLSTIANNAKIHLEMIRNFAESVRLCAKRENNLDLRIIALVLKVTCTRLIKKSLLESESVTNTDITEIQTESQEVIDYKTKLFTLIKRLGREIDPELAEKQTAKYNSTNGSKISPQVIGRFAELADHVSSWHNNNSANAESNSNSPSKRVKILTPSSIRSLANLAKEIALKRNDDLNLDGEYYYNLAWKRKIDDIFDTMDQDRSGFVNRSELLHMYRNADPEILKESTKDFLITRFLDNFDTDGDGRLSYDEWILHLRLAELSGEFSREELSMELGFFARASGASRIEALGEQGSGFKHNV